jgi:hypothetical protein
VAEHAGRYMFRWYDNLQVDTHTLEINATANGSVDFWMLVILVDNGDRSLVTIDTVAVLDFTITCSAVILAL